MESNEELGRNEYHNELHYNDLMPLYLVMLCWWLEHIYSQRTPTPNNKPASPYSSPSTSYCQRVYFPLLHDELKNIKWQILDTH